MKALGIITSLLFSGLVFSETLQECENQGARYGDGKSKTYISSSCENLFESKAHFHAKKELIDQDLKIFGYKNILFMHLGAKSGLKSLQTPANLNTLVITGEQAGFEDVLALDLDLVNNTVVALVIDSKTRKESILTFDLYIGGNITPRRRIYSDELTGATSLKLDTAKNLIYVLYKDDAKLASYHLMDNTYGVNAKKFGKVQSLLEKESSGLTSIQDLVLTKDSNDLFILDSKAKKVFQFNSLGFSLIKEFDIYSDSKEYLQLELDSTSQALKVRDSKGGELTLLPFK